MIDDLLQKIDNSKQPDFGDVLSKSFELFKKVWLEGFVHLLISMLIIIPALLVAYIPMMGWIASTGLSGGFDTYAGSQSEPPIMIMILTFLLFFVVIVFAQVFSLAVSSHFFRVCKKEDTGSPIETGGYFAYLKEVGFMKMLILSFAMMGITFLAALLCYLPIFYVIVPVNLMMAIFAFHPNLSVSDIVKAGFKLGNKHWLIFFGLILVSGIIAQLGIIACGIGVLFTASYTQIVLYYMFKDTVGFDDDNSEEVTETF